MKDTNIIFTKEEKTPKNLERLLKVLGEKWPDNYKEDFFYTGKHIVILNNESIGLYYPVSDKPSISLQDFFVKYDSVTEIVDVDEVNAIKREMEKS